MNDNNSNSWIEYYLWELDFGRNWKKGIIKTKSIDFKLQSPSHLWDLLNSYKIDGQEI